MSGYMQLADNLLVDENSEISIRQLVNSVVEVMNFPYKPEVCSSLFRARST